MNILFFLSLCVLTVQRALAVDFICPQEIKTTQSLEGPSTEAWEAHLDKFNGRNIFQRIALSSSPGNGSLAPYNKGETKVDHFWPIYEDSKYWISCMYTNTNVRLEKPLPAGFKKCTLKTKAHPISQNRIADKLVCI